MRPFLLVILLLTACVPQVQLPPVTVPPIATTAPASLPVTVPPPVTSTPGIVLRGHVRLADGSGVPGVTICRSYASYPGEAVAITDQTGYFESAFAFIPGDEMISVWALAPGYTFDPPYDYWRHYFGLEDHSLDFVASPASA